MARGWPSSVTQQADDNLQLSALSVAVIAEGTESVMLAFEIGAGDVVEKQALGRSLFFKQGLFDIRLLICEPIEIGVEIVFVEAAQSNDLSGGMHPREPYRRQSRSLIDDAGDDLPQRQLSLTRGAKRRRNA